MRKVKNTNIANVGRQTAFMDMKLGTIEHKQKKGKGSYTRKSKHKEAY